MKKYHFFLSENFHFLVVKFSLYLNRHVIVMVFVSKGNLLDFYLSILASKPFEQG